jgi:O-antigen biosynthesis protein WbqP
VTGTFYSRHVKRLVDFCAAAVALIVLAPVMLLVAIAIRIEDGGPSVFRQTRVGRGNRQFTLFKFRSMPVTAPNVPSASAQHIALTRVGRMIRRTNLDELPQLYNVLRGDMSLIGPRPALPSQRSLLELRNANFVMDALPGLTGLAQVNAFDGMSEEQKVEWERRYVASITLWGDMAILGRTFVYLLHRPPVY